MTLEEAFNLVQQLSLIDKVRLIERLAPKIEQELVAASSTAGRSLWGLCADLGTAPSAEEIDGIRQQEWATFPQEDI
ncbi:MAG: hypothetical protein KME17_16815 [Cyanosarcina radialis HA8281-LM2]|jgi:hypothetical protein|nr:hypothetical protein [Cyanosarcina radialis HA8281-LM2]